jgi:two-component system, NtrC family, sensor kinase
VSRQIMNNLRKSYPEFSYKRAAHNPRNSLNGADEFESKMLAWFSVNSKEMQWEGMVKKNGQTFYTRMTPIWVEEQCLVCHGDPSDAPRDLIMLYGDRQSFGFSVGDIVGADTIYIPMDKTNLQIKEKTAWVFLFGVLSLFSLFALFALLFNRTVVKQLKRLLLNLKSIYSDDQKDPLADGPASADELIQIREAFQQVTANLKKVHDDLKNSEQKYRTLFHASPYTIFVCNSQGDLTDLNEAGMALLELEASQVYESTMAFADLFHFGEEGRNLLNRVETNGLVANVEFTLVSQTGRQIICLIAASRLRNEVGEFTGFEGVLTDITEQKRLSKLMAQTERMASIGQLAAGVAHEINNPLGVILCYGDLILKNNGSNSQIREDTEVIQKHANGAKTIVDSLLNFARVSDTKMEKADIHQCLEDVLSVLQSQMEKKNITVTINLDDEIGDIVFDGDKIKQVFMNLLLNSMQAMPDGGRLDLVTHLNGEMHLIEITVSDTGTGIPEDKRDKIFEPFFTTKERGKGTGLGLSVSYGIIKQHNGDISVTSNDGSGTTFSIHLPLDGGPSQPEAVRSEL